MRHLSISFAMLTAASPATADSTDPCAPIEATDAKAPTLLGVPKPGLVRVRGTLRERSTKAPAIGATVVAVRTGVSGEEVVITDDQGAYAFDLVPGNYRFTIYYNDAATERSLTIAGAVTVPPIAIDDTVQGTGCLLWYGPMTSPDFGSVPRFGITSTRRFAPTGRDRTHRAWIAPAAAADPRTSVITIDGGARLQSAPGIPTAFLEEATTYTLNTPILTASGSGGGTDLALRGGSNQHHGEARAVIGLDRETGPGGVEAFAGGPIVKDKLWYGTGLVATNQPDEMTDASGLAVVNYAKSSDHQLGAQALAQSLHDGTRDRWANAHWVSKLLDGKLELHAGLVAEQLVLPETTEVGRAAASPIAGGVIDRASGKVQLRWRVKMLGSHAIGAVASAGGGMRGDTEHADTTAGLGDSWQLRPNIELAVGARVEARRFGDETATVVTPRASLTYDVTQEGRSDIFVAYQRVPHLDDGLPGDWVTAPVLAHDEVAAGASYSPGEGKIMFGVAGRARWLGDADAELGIETWARYELRTMFIHAGAASLDRVATLVGQVEVFGKGKHELRAGTATRVSPDRREHALALAWMYALTKELHLDTTVEGYAGTLGPGGRVLMGARW